MKKNCIQKQQQLCCTIYTYVSRQCISFISIHVLAIPPSVTYMCKGCNTSTGLLLSDSNLQFQVLGMEKSHQRNEMKEALRKRAPQMIPI